MPQLFLPFAIRWQDIELRAIEIKAARDFGPYEAVSPVELADRTGVGLVDPVFFDTLDIGLRRALLEDHTGRHMPSPNGRRISRVFDSAIPS